MPLSPELVAVIACPKCKGTLVEEAEPAGFSCAACQLLFKTEDDIPNFLIEEATPWPPPRGR